jgi:hypothetical protein
MLKEPLKRYKSSCIDQIAEELIETKVRTDILGSLNLLIWLAGDTSL